MTSFRSTIIFSLMSALALLAPTRVNSDQADLLGDLEVDSLSSAWPVGQLTSIEPIPKSILESLDMDTAVRLAKDRNPSIQEKYQLFLASRDDLASNFASWWPTIDFDLSLATTAKIPITTMQVRIVVLIPPSTDSSDDPHHYPLIL